MMGAVNKKWLVGVSVVSVATMSCSDDPVEAATGGVDTGLSTDGRYDDGSYEDDGYYDDGRDDGSYDDGSYDDTYSLDDGYSDTYYSDDGYSDTYYEDDGYYEDTWYSDDGYYGTTFGYEDDGYYSTTFGYEGDTTTGFDESTTGDFDSTTSVETSFTTGTDGMFTSSDGGSTAGGSTAGGSTAGGSTDGGSTDGGSTDGGSTGTTGGTVVEIFEDPQPFGDQVTELDLIGEWNLPTDGSNPGYSMTLSVFPDGEFEWVEHDGDCIIVREATGALWVTGGSLVMLFDTFTGVAPWPVMDQFGFDSEAPFLIRFGYAPVLGHIALTGPPDLRVGAPWASRGYRRTVGGATAVDVWVTEAELWDVEPGNTEATIIVRDRYTLDIGAGPDATLTHNRWWYDGGVQITDPPEVSMLPFMDDGLANLTLDGAPYVYLSDSMASYAPGDNFQVGAPSACFDGGGG